MPHTLIFDIGKTNKKCFLFDEKYREVYRTVIRMEEISDDDGDPCDDLQAIEKWIKEKFDQLLKSKRFDIDTVNFSTYGASLVHIGKNGKPIAPLYNYLKPYPENISNLFYEKYGDANALAKATASPPSRMLNAGLQLFWLKQAKPQIFRKTKWSLHFPQYLSFLFTGVPLSDFTSVGCHTSLWDYKKKDYHDWVFREKVFEKLPPLVTTVNSLTQKYHNRLTRFGIGIHDSSAALLPYLLTERKPFVLISTGTWNVTLNPFYEKLLTDRDLENDCLCYMQTDGKSVRASRLFLGNEYRLQVEKLSRFFGKPKAFHKNVRFDKSLFFKLKKDAQAKFHFESIRLPRQHPDRTDLQAFENYETAYHRLMIELTDMQIRSTRLAIGESKIKKVYIDGGFAGNDVFIKMMAYYLPEYKIRVSRSSQGPALGAAMAVAAKKLKTGFLKKHFGLKKHRPPV